MRKQCMVFLIHLNGVIVSCRAVIYIPISAIWYFKLHTPIITHYKHTRQDRRIQKEMDFTQTKNVTKLNPSKNRTTAGHKEEDQLDDLRNIGESSCNPGDGTDQRVQSLMFMMTYFNARVLHTPTPLSHTHTSRCVMCQSDSLASIVSGQTAG
jgi:hypothetical protein